MTNEWFRHDYNAHEDIKQKRLIKRHGMSAIGFYWYLVELLYQNGGKLEDREVRLEAELLDSLDCLDSFIEFELFKIEDGFWLCKRVSDELSYREEQRLRKSEAGKKGMSSRWNNTVITLPNTVMKNDNTVITLPPKSITDDNTKRDNNNNNNKPLSVSNDTSSPLQGEVPFSQIQEFWNSSCEKSGLPKCTKISDKRRNAIRSIWIEFGEDVYTAINKVSESDFLTGRDGKWNGCGFDWLFIKGNMLKVLEGNYDNKSASKPKHKDYSDVKKEDFDLKNFNWGL